MKTLKDSHFYSNNARLCGGCASPLFRNLLELLNLLNMENRYRYGIDKE